MFDAKNGKRVFDRIYKRVLDEEAIDLWYEDDYYCIDECWSYAAGNAMEYESVTVHEKTDLMSYIIECNPDNIDTIFGDGFSYLFGNMMQNEYEMGE